MQVYTFYWLLGDCDRAFALVAISVAWYLLRAAHLCSAGPATVFEARITGLYGVRLLSSHDVFNPHHKVYITRATYSREPIALVAVVFSKTNVVAPRVPLFYTKDEEYQERLDSNGRSARLATASQISLCLQHAELVLVRDAPMKSRVSTRIASSAMRLIAQLALVFLVLAVGAHPGSAQQCNPIACSKCRFAGSRPPTSSVPAASSLLPCNSGNGAPVPLGSA